MWFCGRYATVYDGVCSEACFAETDVKELMMSGDDVKQVCGFILAGFIVFHGCS